MKELGKTVVRLTDEEVEAEIERLKESEYVKLSKAEERVRYRRRQLLYNLRCHEKRGKKLAELGWSPELEEPDYEE